MERKWLARLSMVLSVAMIAGLTGVWRASGARASVPVVTIGVDLLSASLEDATYELIVTNRGTADAQAIRVTDVVPRGARFVSARPAPAGDSDCANGGVREGAGAVCRWNVASLAAGEERSVQVTFDLAPVKRDRKVVHEALAAMGQDVSAHKNDRLRLSATPLDSDAPCGATPSTPREIAPYVAPRTLTDGGALERLWGARVVCGDGPAAPRLYAAAQAAATPSCIDVDPEAAGGAANSEVSLVALVTDGEATNRTGAESANDSCSGVGQNNINVIFTIEDDVPDAYIARVETFQTSGQPNQQTGTTDANGRTDIGVRLVNPSSAPGATDTNRVSGRIDGTPDQPEQATPCLVPPPPVGTGCPGQAANEDDVIVTWGGPGPTGSASPTGTSTSTATPTGSPTATGTATPTATSTTTARPTGTATSSPRPSGTATRGTTTPGQSARTVTLFTSSAKTSYGRRITLSGQVFSSNASCDDVGESVRIRKRVHGESAFVDAGAASTDISGRFSVEVQALQSADYIAVAPAHDQCAEATSPSVTTLVRVKVSAKPSSQRVAQGASFRIRGKVTPKHSGQVKLQRKKGRKWVGAGKTRLTGRGTYVFRLNAGWDGRRAFRVVWPSQDQEHEKGTSKRFVVRAT